MTALKQRICSFQDKLQGSQKGQVHDIPILHLQLSKSYSSNFPAGYSKQFIKLERQKVFSLNSQINWQACCWLGS